MTISGHLMCCFNATPLTFSQADSFNLSCVGTRRSPPILPLRDHLRLLPSNASPPLAWNVFTISCSVAKASSFSTLVPSCCLAIEGNNICHVCLCVQSTSQVSKFPAAARQEKELLDIRLDEIALSDEAVGPTALLKGNRQRLRFPS